MQYSIILISLFAAVAQCAPLGLVTRQDAIDLGPLGDSKTIHAPCDGNKDKTCKVILEGIVVHTPDDFKDHLGTQTGIITHGIGGAVYHNGNPDLASQINEAGQDTAETLGGTPVTDKYERRDDSSNQAAKDAAIKYSPTNVLPVAGEQLDTEGTVVQEDVGGIVKGFTHEADRFFGQLNNGYKLHSGEVIDYISPNDE